MEQQQDPVFGVLSFDVYWEGRTSSTALGPEVDVFVEADHAEPPSNAQREAFLFFLQEQHVLKQKTEAAIFAYYERVKHRYRQFEPDCAPDIEGPHEVWKLLSHPSIYVPYQEPGERKIKVTWASEWDEEHGLQVKLEALNIVDVGVVS